MTIYNGVEKMTKRRPKEDEQEKTREDGQEEEDKEETGRYYRFPRRYYRSGGITAPSAAENPSLRPCAALLAVLPPEPAVLPLWD